MKAEVLLNLPWKRVNDWSNLAASYKKPGEAKKYVEEQDIDKFVSGLIRNMSHSLDIPYRDLMKVVYKQNGTFLEQKRQMFSENQSYPKESRKLYELEMEFMIPNYNNEASQCYLMFNRLTDEEKQRFLDLVGSVKI